tara:strand:- start:1285 stop:1701 length:417 start_codon:yes stop_codon:yes gene_type:complete
MKKIKKELQFKGYTRNSLYNWEAFNKKKFRIRKKTSLLIIEDYIQLYDFFWVIDSFINHLNESKDYSFKLEEKLSGIQKLFVFGMITNESHKNVLTEIAHNIIEATRLENITVRERAEMVELAIRNKVLQFKNLVTYP